MANAINVKIALINVILSNWKNEIYAIEKENSGLKFKLVCNIRTRTSKAFKSQKIKKTNKSMHLPGFSRDFFKEWAFHQLYVDMTSENYGSLWELDHCYPLSKTNPSKQNDLFESTNWINSRPK